MKMSPTIQRSLKWASRFNIVLYRLTGGIIGGKLVGGRVLLLTTIGRKSGEARTVPLLYLPWEKNLVVVASKGGHDEAPLWFSNLEKTPDATVEVGRERRPVRARVAGDEDRAVLWPQIVGMYKGYAAYQERTERQIPLVILEPR